MEFNEKKSILHQITKASDAIRKKHKMLKLGRELSETYSNEIFKPIVTPLQKFIDQQQEVKPEVKQEIKNELEVSNMKEDFDDSFENETIKVNELWQPNKTFVTSTPNNVEKYLRKLNEKKKDYGGRYEVRKLKKGFMFGDSEMNFNNSQVEVGDYSYKETPGLLELLFNKSINDSLIKEDDTKNFIEIIQSTNAHRNYYKSDGAIRGDNSSKYMKYISPYIKSLDKTGKGLPHHKATKINNNFDYVYWDDPNELVDRLRLLVASQTAGNQSHTNEIVSIIEELREAQIIY